LKFLKERKRRGIRRSVSISIKRRVSHINTYTYTYTYYSYAMATLDRSDHSDAIAALKRQQAKRKAAKEAAPKKVVRDKQGWMVKVEKKGDKRLFFDFNFEAKEVCYFNTAEVTSKPVGIISLEGALGIRPLILQKNPLAPSFCIRDAMGVSHVFIAEDDKERTLWIKKMSKLEIPVLPQCMDFQEDEETDDLRKSRGSSLSTSTSGGDRRKPTIPRLAMADGSRDFVPQNSPRASATPSGEISTRKHDFKSCSVFSDKCNHCSKAGNLLKGGYRCSGCKIFAHKKCYKSITSNCVSNEVSGDKEIEETKDEEEGR